MSRRRRMTPARWAANIREWRELTRGKRKDKDGRHTNLESHAQRGKRDAKQGNSIQKGDDANETPQIRIAEA